MEISVAWLTVWLVAISLAATLTTMWDKNRARRREFRVPESTLWLMAVLGGGAAMWVTMFTIRHKTRHRAFMIGLPLLTMAEVGLVALLWRMGTLIFI